jgi:cytochrome c biogenesis protein CcdA
MITALNPCCFALLFPAAAGTCCARGPSNSKRDFSKPVAFVIGIAAATAVLGVIAALAGRATGGPGSLIRYAVAAVPLIMGLHVLGWIRLPLSKLLNVGTERFRIASAFGGGFLLSLVIAPCGTPVLASVLSYAAYERRVLYGALLLFLYGFGAGLPVLIAGTAAGRLAERLERKGYQLWVDRATGVLLLALGFYLVWIA